MLTNTYQQWSSRKLSPSYKDNGDGTITLSVITIDSFNNELTAVNPLDKSHSRCDSEIVYRIKRGDGTQTAYGPFLYPYDKIVPKADIGTSGAALSAEVIYYQPGSNDITGTVFGTAIGM